MSQQVIAFTGLSGVGKTTFLRKLMNLVPFQHLTGGSLIAAGRNAETANRDAMRHADLDENQQLLVNGFLATRDPKVKVVFLDGHVVIDDGKCLVELPCGVFRRIGTTMMVHLEATPVDIASNRSKDKTRSRPFYDVQTLERHQNLSGQHARAIAQKLEVSFQVVTHDDVSKLAKIICSES